jgi:molybdate transport system permease protein
MRRSDRLVAIGFALAAALLVGFVVLPMAAIFLRVPPGTLLAQLHSRVTLDALAVSLKTTAIALALILLLGTPAAYLLGTRPFRGAVAMETILEVPLVLPPAVAGIALLAAFGRLGLLGGALRAFGIEIGLTQAAVVMALTFVAMPFYVRQAVAAFASLDRQVLAASRTLGAGEGETFLRVAVPLARKGLSAGAALAFARALGEFGATIMFAGNLQGKTETLPLAIYGQYSADNLPGALALAALLVAVSVGLLVGVKLTFRTGRGQGRATWRAFSRSTSGTV